MIAGIIVIAVVVILLLACVGGYNTLVKGRITVDEAFSTMDVYLKKRFDLIPNLVETVKGYAKHESSTLEAVVKMRNVNYGSMSQAEKRLRMEPSFPKCFLRFLHFLNLIRI